MRKEELIKWKKLIDQLEYKKYYELSLLEPVQCTDKEYSEFEVYNQVNNTSDAVKSILKTLEESVLTLASELDIQTAELVLEFSLLVDKKMDYVSKEKFKCLTNTVCIKPDILFTYYEKEDNKLKDVIYSELSRDNKFDLMDEYIVNYSQFFSEMLKYGYNFDIVPFSKLLQNVYKYLSNELFESNFESVNCLINFGKEKVK